MIATVLKSAAVPTGLASQQLQQDVPSHYRPSTQFNSQCAVHRTAMPLKGLRPAQVPTPG